MNVRNLLLTSSLFLLAGSASAQTSKGFVITGGENNYQWENIHSIDLKAGTFSDKLYNINAEPAAQGIQTLAASAYDRRTGKLFFIPMRSNVLQWIDTDQKKGSGVNSKSFVQIPFNNSYPEENLNITRMTIGADGVGYALTNDGSHLYSFTTGKNIELTDLGSLRNAEKNGEIDIHTKCTSWGGDMVAGANGNLYIFTAQKYVFEVNVKTREAVYITTLQGLPTHFTLNAAAVDEDGSILIAGAQFGIGMYRVDPSTWEVDAVPGSINNYSISDMASGNLLKNAKQDFNSTVYDIKSASTRIYPNPVVDRTFRFAVHNMDAGKYSMQIADAYGKIIQTNALIVAKGMTSTQVSLSSRPVPGVYSIRVLNAANEVVATDQLVIK